MVMTDPPLSIKKTVTPPGKSKSWKTSHLPSLQEHETKGVLDLMGAWYHDEQFVFSEKCNWPILWEYIDRNGLGGILGSSILDGICEIPEKFSQMASHRYFSNQMQYEQTRECCTVVGMAAQELNIPVRILKGPAIVHQGYVDTGVRSFSDIDIFTDSLESVHRLCEHLQGSVRRSFEKQNVFERLGESECFSFLLLDRELEFRYPLDPPGEPMFEMLLRHKENLLKVPRHADEILLPDVGLHLVFLIQHMAIHHLFSRFFWFLDLAVLARNNTQIDYEMVEEELQHLGLKNAAHVASQFCRTYIDPDFPVFTHLKPSWNYAMMTQLAAPDNIASGRFGIYHQNFSQKAYAYLVGVVSFYIIADPSEKLLGFGTDWTLNRLKNSFGLRKPLPLIDFILGSVIALGLLPITLALTYITSRGKNKQYPSN
jgi:hypothetical protein